MEYAKKSLALSPHDGDAWLVLADTGPGVLPDAEMRELFRTASTAFENDPVVFGYAVLPRVMAMYLGGLSGIPHEVTNTHRLAGYLVNAH